MTVRNRQSETNLHVLPEAIYRINASVVMKGEGGSRSASSSMMNRCSSTPVRERRSHSGADLHSGCASYAVLYT